MKIRYSKVTGTFYPLDIEYPNGVPDDVQLVDVDDHKRALARAPGETFSFDKGGVLTITPAPVIPFSEIAEGYLATVRTTREMLLNRITGIAWAAQAVNDTATTAAILTARQALLDITKAPAVVAATTLDGLKSAVLAEYRRIAGATPAAVQRAFAGVDA